MNGKFIVYALIIVFISVVASWSKLLTPGQGGSSYRSGSSWSSHSGDGSWGGGGHK